MLLHASICLSLPCSYLALHHCCLLPRSESEHSDFVRLDPALDEEYVDVMHLSCESSPVGSVGSSFRFIHRSGMVLGADEYIKRRLYRDNGTLDVCRFDASCKISRHQMQTIHERCTEYEPLTYMHKRAPLRVDLFKHTVIHSCTCFGYRLMCFDELYCTCIARVLISTLSANCTFQCVQY